MASLRTHKEPNPLGPQGLPGSVDNGSSRFSPKEIGLFNPSLDVKQGQGDVLRIGSETHIHDVRYFIDRIKDTVCRRGENIVKANLPLCLQGPALEWFISLTKSDQDALRTGPIGLWYNHLENKWKAATLSENAVAGLDIGAHIHGTWSNLAQPNAESIVTGGEADIIRRSPRFLEYTILLSKAEKQSRSPQISVEVGPISRGALPKYVTLVSDHDGVRKRVEGIILGGARDAIGKPFDDLDDFLDKVKRNMLDGLKPLELKVYEFKVDTESIEFQKFVEQWSFKAAAKAQVRQLITCEFLRTNGPKELKDECLANVNMSLNPCQGRESTTCILLFAECF